MSRFVKVTRVHLKPIKEELTKEQKRIYVEPEILGYEPVGHTEIDINVDSILSMCDDKGVTRLEVTDFASGSNLYHVLETIKEIYNAEKRGL